MNDQTVVRLPEPLEELPCTETGLMQLCSALGIFEQHTPPDQHYRTAFFGSARIPEEHPVFAEAKRFGRILGESGIDGVSGGGPSLMEAFNEGLLEGKRLKGTSARSYGLSIGCYPDERPNRFLEKEYKHGHYATRLHHFSRLGKSFVVAPLAGIGTALELLWVWQLLQAKQLKPCPFILAGDMWPPLLEWMRQYMLERSTIKASDLELVTLVPTLDDAASLVLEHHRGFHALSVAG